MGARYFDNVVAWPSTEPSDDYTALSIVLFAGKVTEACSQVKHPLTLATPLLTCERSEQTVVW